MSTTPTSTTPSKRPAVMCPYCVSERRAREKRLRKSSAGCSPAAAAAPPPPPVGCPIVIIDDDDDEDEDEVDKEEEEVGGAVHDGHEKRRAAQGTRSKKGGQGEAPVIVISSSSEGEEESEAADIGKSGARGGAAMGTDKVQASAAAVMGAKEPQPAVVAEVAVVRADDSTKLVGEVVDNPQECERERSNAATNVPGEENANSKPNLSEIDTHEKSEQDTITTPSPFLPVPQAYDSFNDTDFIFDESILDDTFAAMSKQSNHTTETTSTSTSIENTSCGNPTTNPDTNSASTATTDCRNSNLNVSQKLDVVIPPCRSPLVSPSKPSSSSLLSDLSPSEIDALNAMAEELACMPSENLFTTGSLQQTKFLQIRVNEITREGGASVTAFTGTCCNVDGRVDLQLPVTIQLEGIWRLSPIENGSVVHVIGGHHSAYSVITLQDSEGIIIVHPEILISASLLGATSPCLRQSVLRNTVKNVGTTKASLIGQISHSIFEEALSSSSFTESTVAKAMDDIIQDNIPSLFAVGLTDQATRSSLLPTIATISKWASTFLPTITHLTKSLGSCPPEVYFGHERKTVKITSVLGIEEGIWSLMYGVKGILDAHIRAEVDGVSSEIPLELKTGKPHTDHKAQVLLYMLLMSEHFKTETSKGLLYYMNGHNRFGIGNMMGISSSCTELAAILHQRNMLATALSTHILPPTCLSSECSSCSNSFTCALFNKAFEQGDLVKVNPLVSHLLPAHFLFFRKWSRLISLEAQSGHQVFLDLISKTPSKRELSGSCLCNLTLHTSLRQGFHYFHTFFTQNSNPYFGVGDSVLMTHTKCVAIVYRGRIVEVDSKKIVVQSDSLLRGGQLDIEDMASHMSWNIDKEDETSSFPHMQSNLCALFENNPTAAKIRSLLIDLVTPRFDTVPESDETLSQQLFPLSQSLSYNNLNVQQKFAIKRALAAKDYLLIHGMPGTGKTTTIAYLVQALVHRGKRVLIVAYTHNAIDNVLLKLIDLKIRFLRIGRPETVHVKVKPYATEENKSLTIDALKALLDSTQVIGATCLGVKNVIVKSQHYDCCIVDEASQITVPVCLPPIMLSSRFILVGDHMQLPPLVRSEPAKQEGFDKSLFFLLSESHPEAVIELYLQYRMNSDIMLIANKLVYSDKLKCIDTTVENAKLDVRNHRATSPRWVYECLEPSRKVIFLDTDNVPAQEFHSGGSVWNDTEALIVCMIISELVSCGIQCQSIGVITPYRGQTRCIAAALKQELRAQPQAVGEVEVHTIDSYQGRDKDCVIFSMVCSNPELRVGDLLEDLRRINVACTRAKKKLVFVGSRRTMDQSGIWQQFLALAQSRGWIYSMPPRPQSLPNKPLHVGDLP